MSDPQLDNYRFCAEYNQWFNQRLYAAASTLSDEDRKLERGAFFGSIHRTLNHLVVADQIWLRRLHQHGLAHGFNCLVLCDTVLDLPAGTSLSAVPYDDWQALKDKRAQLDEAIIDWLADMPAGFPTQTMRYSNTTGAAREHPAWMALTHLFNHQTHHRGQVTTLLMQAGVDVGVTDMVALLPGVKPV